MSKSICISYFITLCNLRIIDGDIGTMQQSLSDITEKIKKLKSAREILNNEYINTDFHKKREEHPNSTVPTTPEDEEIYKLLTAIQQIDKFIKEFQDQQFLLIKKQDST